MFKTVVILCVFITLSHQFPRGRCPDVDGWRPVYLPDSVDCRAFYECSNGHPRKLHCPPGTIFSSRRNVCVHSNRRCVPNESEDMISRMTDNDGPSLAKECPKVDGEWPTYLINPKNCSQFFECYNGNPVLDECPKGLNFNAAKLVCDTPENANCKEEA